MTPTAKQRYLTKPADMTHEAFYVLHPTCSKHLDGVCRVLQQWWEGDVLGIKSEGEWRDIEIAREE